MKEVKLKLDIETQMLISRVAVEMFKQTGKPAKYIDAIKYLLKFWKDRTVEE